MDENLEQKYEILVDNLLDIIVELDLNGNFIFISPQSIDITGYHHDEIIGTSIYQCIHPNDLSILKNAIEDAKIDRKHISLEFRIKHKNGNYIYLSAKGRLVEIDGKQKIIVLASDLSKSKGDLEESEKILNKIIDQTFMGFAILQDFEVKFLNPKFSEVIGYSYEEIMNWKSKDVFKIIHPQDREEFISLAQELYLGNNDALNSFQFRIIKKSGVPIWLEIQTKPIKYKGNKADFIFLQDITSNKEAEQELKESEEKYRLITEHANDLIDILDEKFRYEYINEETHKRVLEYSKEDMIGKFAGKFVHPDDMEAIVEKLREGFEKGIGMTECRIRKKDGTYIWYESKGNVFIDKNGNRKALIMSRDITERKLAFSKQNEASEKLKEKNIELSVLNRIITIGNESTNLKEFLEKSYDQVLDIVGFDRGGVYLYNPETQHNFLVHHKNVHDNFIAAAEDVDISAGLFSTIFDKYNPFYIEDFTVIMENSKELGIYSAAIIPLRSKDKYVGSLNIGSQIHQILSENELELLVALGKQMGIIIQKFESERSLKESEEKYGQLFKILPLSLILISREGIYVDCNTGTEKLFGYKREDLIGKNFRSLPIIPSNNAPLFEERLEFLFKGEILEPVVFEALRKNGESVWINSHVSLVKIRNKNLALIIGQDITNERRAAYKIKESEEKYRHLFEKSPFSIILFDSKGIIKDCNSASEGLFGFKKEDLLGYNYFNNPSINHDHLPITKKRFEQLKEGESLLPQDLKIVRADRTSIWVNSQISKVKIINQTYFYSIIQDITTKKILEDIMFELNQNFFNFTSDFQENIQSLTQTAAKLSHGNLVLYAKKVLHDDGTFVQIITSENEVIECDFIDFKQKYFINEIFELKLETPKFFPILSKNNYTMEDPFIQKYSLKGIFGKVIKNIDDFTSIIAILYENPPEISHEEQLVLLLISDAIAIEEKRWQLLEKLEEQNTKLNELDKLKSEFLRRISHELKTPLISIKGYSQLLLYNNKGIFDNDTLSMIKEITRGCVRLENLIKELIESSKLESAQVKLKVTFEDLALLINNSVNELQGVAKSRNQEIILNIHEKLITKFEKERMHEVIGNLLTNAIKYSPPSNSIVIKSEITDGFYVISVRDNGIGFTPEEKLKLFKQFGKIDRFDQETNLAAEGSGLGLYITKKLVELHGGKIWVESEGRNKGSTFYFTLPIIKD